MAKVRVPVLGTVGKSVQLDPNATVGAVLGTNLYTPDGGVGTPATVRAWLGVSESGGVGIAGGAQHHRLLQGLTLGDDHPQYTQWVQDEIVTGDWRFRTYEGIWIENPDYLDAGVHITTFSGDDPLNDGIGNQIAFWEVGNGGAFTPHSYGFRIRHTGDVDLEGNLDFYRHQNDTVGVRFMRFTRDSSQIQFIGGPSSTPILTTFGDLDTGVYFPSANTIGLTAGSNTLEVTSDGSNRVTTLGAYLAGDGTNSAPSYSFRDDTNTGIYSPAENVVGFATAGSLRLRIAEDEHASTGGIQSMLSLRAMAGSASGPGFAFVGDANTGFYSAGADIIGVTVGGTLRASWSTAALNMAVQVLGTDGSAAAPSYAFVNEPDCGLYVGGTNILGLATAGAVRFLFDAGGALGLGGANYGSAGQVLTSSGPGASPVWSSAGAGIVASIVPGNGIVVDDYADPTNPEVSVDETFAFTWTGLHTWTAVASFENHIRINSATPVLRFNETDAGTNEKIWRLLASGGDLFLTLRTDADAVGSTFLQLSRNGVDAENLGLTFTGSLSINGDAGTVGQLLTSNATGPPTWEDPPSGGAGVTVDVYTANDTWNKPAGTAWVEVICVGQGGGGGGGSKRATSTTRAGGGGGGGGGFSRAVVRASDLPSTVAVSVNGGGTGGAGASSDSTSGTAGTAGNPSAFGTLIRATGGGGGSNGAANTNAGGAGGIGTVSDGAAGGTGGTTTTGTVGSDAKYAGAGGGGGHGVSSANNVGTGLNNGGGVTLTNPALTGGAAGASAGAAGAAGGTTGDAPAPGAGGGGGAGNGTGGASGGNGGAGGAYGGGGGGGAGATNGAGSGGTGGNGGSGIVIVISYPS